METFSRTDALKAAVIFFANAASEPKELNAIYDALNNNRQIESIFPTGIYRYKAGGNQQVGVTDYIPAAVATNPMMALEEAGSSHVEIHLSFHHKRAWFVTCVLDNGLYVGEVINDDREQAIARALVIAICKKMLGGEAQNG